MPTDNEPLVLRTRWGRFDKVWWFGSTLFYGLPCGAPVAGAGIRACLIAQRPRQAPLTRYRRPEGSGCREGKLVSTSIAYAFLPVKRAAVPPGAGCKVVTRVGRLNRRRRSK
jgi:hypothetical protein